MNTTARTNSQTSMRDSILATLRYRGREIDQTEEEMIGNCLWLVIRYRQPGSSDLYQQVAMYTIGPRGAIRRERHI